MRASSCRCSTTVSITGRGISDAPALLKCSRWEHPGVSPRTMPMSRDKDNLINSLHRLLSHAPNDNSYPVKMQSRVTGRALPVLGGALCLDFVNTIDPRLEPPREDFLPTFEALIGWAVFVGAADPAEAAALAAGARRDPGQAAQVHARAIEFREALFELLRPPRRTGQPPTALAVVNQELRRALAGAELTPAASNYRLASRPSKIGRA